MWVDRDVEYVLDEQERRDGLCPGCGHPKVDTWSTEADEMERYEAEIVKCHACGTGRATERAYGHGFEQADTDGLYTVILDRWEDGRPEVGDA